MISVSLARSLRDAGLRWAPADGDRFVIADRDMDEQVFVLSEMTVELHQYPSGPVIGFNGTTEWALDSLDQSDALWMPAEHQLRDLLGDGLRSLERDGSGWAVVVDVDGGSLRTAGETPAEAYGLAALAALLRADVRVD